MPGPLFLFDFDKTLYAYDFHKRLPALAELTGASEYHLAKTWWVAGHEAAAESGEYPSSGEYLAAFETVTGYPLTLAEWQQARLAAMTPIPAAVDTLRAARQLGTVSLLSNNPVIFRESLPVLAPDVHAILGENDLVSAVLGARKPEHSIYRRAIERFGVAPHNAMLIDDSSANLTGAAEVGLSTFQVEDTEANTDRLITAIEAFAKDCGG